MAKKTTIKRISSNNKDLETQFATAQRLLREARAHIGFEMLGDQRYLGAEGWDDEPVTQWFAEVDSLVGPAFPGGGVQPDGGAAYPGAGQDPVQMSDEDIEAELKNILGC